MILLCLEIKSAMYLVFSIAYRQSIFRCSLCRLSRVEALFRSANQQIRRADGSLPKGYTGRPITAARCGERWVRRMRAVDFEIRRSGISGTRDTGLFRTNAASLRGRYGRMRRYR